MPAKRVVCKWTRKKKGGQALPTQHPRVQVPKDPELIDALRVAESHFPPDLPVSQQIRQLAILGSKTLAGTEDDAELRERLERLAESFDDPAALGLDWGSLREGKRCAWPLA